MKFASNLNCYEKSSVNAVTWKPKETQWIIPHNYPVESYEILSMKAPLNEVNCVNQYPVTKWLSDCSSFIRHLWQSTKHIKWSSKVVHKSNIIRAYNHTTYITRTYSASQVSCTLVLSASYIEHCFWDLSYWYGLTLIPACGMKLPLKFGNG